MLYRLFLAPFHVAGCLMLAWTRFCVQITASVAVQGVLFQAYLLETFLSIYENFWPKPSVVVPDTGLTKPASLRWWTNRLYAFNKPHSHSPSRSRAASTSSTHISEQQTSRCSARPSSPLQHLQTGLASVRSLLEASPLHRLSRAPQPPYTDHLSPLLSRHCSTPLLHASTASATAYYVHPHGASGEPCSPIHNTNRFLSWPSSPTAADDLSGWQGAGGLLVSAVGFESDEDDVTDELVRISHDAGPTQSPSPTRSPVGADPLLSIRQELHLPAHFEEPQRASRGDGRLSAATMEVLASGSDGEASAFGEQPGGRGGKMPAAAAVADICVDASSAVIPAEQPECGAVGRQPWDPSCFSCKTPIRGEGSKDWGSGSPYDSQRQPGAAKAIAAGTLVANAEANRDGSFDTMPRDGIGRCVRGEGATAAQLGLTVDAVPWPRVVWDEASSGFGGGSSVIPHSSEICREVAGSLDTPGDGGAAAATAALPGSAASCFTLVLSPEFSPRLPLPCTTLLTRDAPSTSTVNDNKNEGSSGDSGKTAAQSRPPPVTPIDEGELPPQPQPNEQRPLHRQQHGQVPQSTRDLCSTPASTSAAVLSQRRMNSLAEKLRHAEVKIPTPSLRSSAIGVPHGRPSAPASVSSAAVITALDDSPEPVSRKVPNTTRRSIVASPHLDISGMAATPTLSVGTTPRTGSFTSSATQVTRSGASMPCLMPVSHQSSLVGISGGDVAVTVSNKKPRYLQSTLSWNLKHE